MERQTENWELKKKENGAVYFHYFKETYSSVVAEKAHLNASVEEVFNFVKTNDWTREVDPNLLNSKTIELLSENIKVCQNTYHVPLMANR